MVRAWTFCLSDALKSEHYKGLCMVAQVTYALKNAMLVFQVAGDS